MVASFSNVIRGPIFNLLDKIYISDNSMDIMNLRLGDWVTCPFNPAHRLKYSKFHNHFVKCQAQHPEDLRKPCPYNYSELIEPKNFTEHVISCPYKKLYGDSSHQRTESLYYDAPCHFKFGPSSRPVRCNSHDTDSSGTDESDCKERDSISSTGRKKSNIDKNFEGISFTRRKNEIESNDNVTVASHVQTEEDVNKKPIARPLAKRGFGRGAFFRKLRSSDHDSVTSVLKDFN